MVLVTPRSQMVVLILLCPMSQSVILVTSMLQSVILVTPRLECGTCNS